MVAVILLLPGNFTIVLGSLEAWYVLQAHNLDCLVRMIPSEDTLFTLWTGACGSCASILHAM